MSYLTAILQCIILILVIVQMFTFKKTQEQLRQTLEANAALRKLLENVDAPHKEPDSEHIEPSVRTIIERLGREVLADSSPAPVSEFPFDYYDLVNEPRTWLPLANGLLQTEVAHGAKHRTYAFRSQRSGIVIVCVECDTVITFFEFSKTIPEGLKVVVYSATEEGVYFALSGATTLPLHIACTRNNRLDAINTIVACLFNPGVNHEQSE